MSNLYYLAAPYTDPSESVRNDRVQCADIVAAWLMEKHGFCIYSPLTHSRNIVPHLAPETVADHRFWMKQCLPMVKAASGLILLPLPGWKDSKGVRMEVEAAQAVMMPIYRLVSHGPGRLEIIGTEEFVSWSIRAGRMHLRQLYEGANPYSEE